MIEIGGFFLIMRKLLLQILLFAVILFFMSGCVSGDEEEIRYLNISFEVWDCRKDPPVNVIPDNDPLFPIIPKVDLEKYAESKK